MTSVVFGVRALVSLALVAAALFSLVPPAPAASAGVADRLSAASPTPAADERPVSPDPASVAAAKRAMARHEEGILKIAGVVGMGIGTAAGARGQAIIEVYVDRATPALQSAIPSTLDGVPVAVVETGTFTPRR